VVPILLHTDEFFFKCCLLKGKKTVKSFNFMVAKFHGLTTIDMFKNTWVSGFSNFTQKYSFLLFILCRSKPDHVFPVHFQCSPFFPAISGAPWTLWRILCSCTCSGWPWRLCSSPQQHASTCSPWPTWSPSSTSCGSSASSS